MGQFSNIRKLIYFTNITKGRINNTSRWSCFQILQKAPHKLKQVLLLGLPEILRPGSTSGPGTWCHSSAQVRPGSQNKTWQVFLDHTHYITVIKSTHTKFSCFFFLTQNTADFYGYCAHLCMRQNKLILAVSRIPTLAPSFQVKIIKPRLGLLSLFCCVQKD